MEHEWLTAYALAVYIVPVLLVFAVGAYIAERFEKRYPQQNRRIRPL